MLPNLSIPTFIMSLFLQFPTNNLNSITIKCHEGSEKDYIQYIFG